MKNRIVVISFIVVLLTVAASSSFAQRRGDQDRSRGARHEQLLSYRITRTLLALDIAVDSEKGMALSAAIREHSQNNWQQMARIRDAHDEIVSLLEQEGYEEANLVKMVLAYEEMMDERKEAASKFQATLKEVLTPVERAKVLQVEREISSRLRQMMRRHRGSSEGRPPRMPPGM